MYDYMYNRKKCKNAMTNFLSPILNVALEGRLSLTTVNGQVIIILRFNLYTPPPLYIKTRFIILYIQVSKSFSFGGYPAAQHLEPSRSGYKVSLYLS